MRCVGWTAAYRAARMCAKEHDHLGVYQVSGALQLATQSEHSS